MLAISVFIFGILFGQRLSSTMEDNLFVFALITLGGPTFMILANVLYGKKFNEILKSL